MVFLKFLYHWVGSIAMIGAFLIGVPDSFNASKEFVSWASPWGVQPIHFAFWLLFIGALVQIIRFRKLENKLPDIIVEPEVINDCAKLIVKNIGAEAEFTAMARVKATVPEAELYRMYWESVPKESCHIDGDGGIAAILVGEKARCDSKFTDLNTFFIKGNLVLYKMSESGKQIFPAFSGEREFTQDSYGQPIYSGRPLDRCIVEVTITATPRLKRKWNKHRYLCEIENEETRLVETNIPTPHKINYLNE